MRETDRQTVSQSVRQTEREVCDVCVVSVMYGCVGVMCGHGVWVCGCDVWVVWVWVFTMLSRRTSPLMMQQMT